MKKQTQKILLIGIGLWLLFKNRGSGQGTGSGTGSGGSGSGGSGGSGGGGGNNGQPLPPMDMGAKPGTYGDIQEVKKAFDYWANNGNHGPMSFPTAAKLERIYRLETNHFKSGQYLKSGSPGMWAHSNVYPYGWTTLKPLWDSRPDLRPVGVTETMSDAGMPVRFVKFPSLFAALDSLAYFLSHKGAWNNPGRWNSLDPSRQQEYNRAIKNVRSQFYPGISQYGEPWS